jgi:hypothetical protein
MNNAPDLPNNDFIQVTPFLFISWSIISAISQNSFFVEIRFTINACRLERPNGLKDVTQVTIRTRQ